MDFQFYPTPIALAHRAWAKFQNKEVTRILEPSAGQGHLLQAIPRHIRRVPVDVCEIDLSFHPHLRALDCGERVSAISVVGTDFLSITQGAQYSTIILNPPFDRGVTHVLHAWRILWNGEIVALLNAETIRNPLSAERRQLNELIARYGSVEFIEGGFSGDDALRRTEVDVALVWLKKTSEVGSFVVSDILDGLQKDQATPDEPKFQQHDLAIPTTVIENYVTMFDQAVAAARDSAKYQTRASFLAERLGKSMGQLTGQRTKSDEGGNASQKATALFSTAYGELRERAWANVLQTADFTSKLSSGAQKQIRAEFDQIKLMQFTTGNVHGFLHGILESQVSIQNDMVCEIFDLVSRYHEENVVYFKGYKSNTRHRTLGMRLKMSRFIVPRCGDNYFRDSITYQSKEMLGDIDKVFSLLEGVSEPEVSLQYLFNTHMKRLCNGERLSSSYFDVRFYRVGTIHFYPRRRDLMDKLNLIVGRQRQWLPPNVNDASDSFWQQYEKAESLDRQVRAKGIDKVLSRVHWVSESEQAKVYEKACGILTDIHKDNGIPDFILEYSQPTPENQQLLLLAA